MNLKRLAKKLKLGKANTNTIPFVKRWNTSLVDDNGRRRSELCKAKDFQTDWYKFWCSEIGQLPHYHRKQWEYVYILQALWERGCIAKGHKGLAFAVGTEPLPSVLAKYGCAILATDIFVEEGVKKGWTDGSQLCFGLDSLHKRELIDEAEFRSLVQYKTLDMNNIPNDLTDYHFNWSSCSFEHLGSIEKGLNFLKNQLKTLRPGGWAVHTTEFNLSSNDRTRDFDNTVIFRMRDIDKLVSELRGMGCYVEELNYLLGGLAEDFEVDTFPYTQKTHLKLQLSEYVVTSVGLLIQKPLADKA